MEKLVLSNGNQFDIVAGGVSERGDTLSFTFILGDKTAEQILSIFTGANTMTVKNGDTSIKVYSGYTVCKEVTVRPDYYYDTEYHCTECDAKVAFDATACPDCKAEFEAPKSVVLTTTVCTVLCAVPDVNSRMTDVENTVSDMILTMLG